MKILINLNKRKKQKKAFGLRLFTLSLSLILIALSFTRCSPITSSQQKGGGLSFASTSDKKTEVIVEFNLKAHVELVADSKSLQSKISEPSLKNSDLSLVLENHASGEEDSTIKNFKSTSSTGFLKFPENADRTKAPKISIVLEEDASIGSLKEVPVKYTVYPDGQFEIKLSSDIEKDAATLIKESLVKIDIQFVNEL